MKKELVEHAAALEYNRACLKSLSSIGEFLERDFSIKLFNYRRIYPNNKFLYLSAYPEWIDHCFENGLWCSDEFHQKINSISTVPQNYLWGANLNDRVFGAAYEFDIAHGLGIYEKHENFIEAFAFSTNKNNPGVNNFYLNNLDLMKSFVVLFKDKARDLINIEQRRLTLSYNSQLNQATCESVEKNSYKIPQDILNVNKFYLTGKHRDIFLSRREAQCAFYLTEGHSAKKTAQILNLSPRTVETHLNNIKQKLSCFDKSKMIENCLKTNWKLFFYHK